MNAAEQSCNQHYDAQVREQTLFRAGQLNFDDHPPFYSSFTDKMALEAYSKLLPRALGPYRVI